MSAPVSLLRREMVAPLRHDISMDSLEARSDSLGTDNSRESGTGNAHKDTD
jgi:hypothetical protein